MKSLVKNGDDIDFEYIEGREEQRQRIKTLIETNLGEWFLNDEYGFDYSAIQEKNVELEDIRIALIECLEYEESFEDLEEVNFELDRQTRKAVITFTALVGGSRLTEVVELG